MRQIRTMVALSIIIAMAGCGTLFKATITLTSIEDSIMKEWATLHNDGKTTPERDREVMKAHDKFNEAKLVAAAALRAYAAGGDKDKYITALETARTLIDPILGLIQPLLAPEKVQTLKLKILNASEP